MGVSVRVLLIVATVVAFGWMHHWANEYIKASSELVGYERDIAREFDDVDYFPELGPEGNKDLVKQVMAQQRSAATYARQMRGIAYEHVEHAKFMLTTVSRWVTAVLLLLWIGTFVTRYRIRLDRKDSQAPAVSAS